MVKLGLVINPIAGVGGKAGLKGSDGEETQRLAIEKGGKLESEHKAKRTLEELVEYRDKIEFLTASGKMGENILKDLGFKYKIIEDVTDKTTSMDTKRIVKKMVGNVDLIIFTGGDGTARDVYDSIGSEILVLGIPSGVKIHSAVYANNPESAGKVIRNFIKNPSGINIVQKEVMDLDEKLYRQNIVQTELYGYMSIPYIKNFIQNPKASSKYSDNNITGIAEELKNMISENSSDTCYIFSTGSTNFQILNELGQKGSLLGVDVFENNKIVLKDASEYEIFNYIKHKNDIKIITTVIGGQGHIFGRGNHQISPRIINKVCKKNIWIVATASKIYNLDDNILRVDTSDVDLDKKLSGYSKVIVGYQERLNCKVEA